MKEIWFKTEKPGGSIEEGRRGGCYLGHHDGAGGLNHHCIFKKKKSFWVLAGGSGGAGTGCDMRKNTVKEVRASAVGQYIDFVAGKCCWAVEEMGQRTATGVRLKSEVEFELLGFMEKRRNNKKDENSEITFLDNNNSHQKNGDGQNMLVCLSFERDESAFFLRRDN
ncbi:unnamed protein product [Amaranthus hypochondriacus]